MSQRIKPLGWQHWRSHQRLSKPIGFPPQLIYLQITSLQPKSEWKELEPLLSIECIKEMDSSRTRVVSNVPDIACKGRTKAIPVLFYCLFCRGVAYFDPSQAKIPCWHQVLLMLRIRGAWSATLDCTEWETHNDGDWPPPKLVYRGSTTMKHAPDET